MSIRDFPDARTDLPQAIEQAVAQAAGLAGAKPVTVVAEYPAHLPAVRGEREQVIHMIIALVGHVVEMVEEGQVLVGAEIQSGDEVEEPLAIVKVLLPASKQVGDQALSLAMSIQSDQSELESALPSLGDVQRQAKQLGGQLWMEGPEREQPRLMLGLPLLAAQRGEGDLRSIVESHLLREAETLLLLVEDPERLQEMAGELGDAGYRVVTTSDGREVLNLAREQHPDLILLDMLARDPGALDVAMVLKQHHQTLNIPVLFLTSLGEPGTERMGAASFLVRPKGTAALVNTIQAVLGAGVSPSGRVLVVEQDAAVREMLVLMIQSHGYRVTEATGAEEGLALAEHIPPELVLVNASMAQERDYWLLRGLRQLGHPFDIFVLAEAMTEAEGQAAVDRGASGFSETGRLPELLDQVRKRKEEGN